MITQDELRDHLLIALRLNCIRHNGDAVDALQFSTDLRYPMHETTRMIADSIRRNEEYFSDSVVDELLERLDELWPTCDICGNDADATLTTMIDLDPVDLETGPQPDLHTIRACSTAHRDETLSMLFPEGL